MGLNGEFEDDVAIGGWPMDDHPPSGFDKPDQKPCVQIKLAEVYGIPLRSLYSRNVKNLMMAGRNIARVARRVHVDPRDGDVQRDGPGRRHRRRRRRPAGRDAARAVRGQVEARRTSAGVAPRRPGNQDRPQSGPARPRPRGEGRRVGRGPGDAGGERDQRADPRHPQEGEELLGRPDDGRRGRVGRADVDAAEADAPAIDVRLRLSAAAHADVVERRHGQADPRRAAGDGEGLPRPLHRRRRQAARTAQRAGQLPAPSTATRSHRSRRDRSAST